MRKHVITLALVAAVLPLSPAMARQTNGYTIRTTVMRAGPDYDYPAVQRLRRNSSVMVYGCLRNWSWCDVGTRYDRGWVAHRDIVVNYHGHRRGITSSMGIVILSFTFGSYWDNHYRSRPFYSERPRWEQQYNNNYRPEWGPRPRAPSVAPQPREPRMGDQPQTSPQRQPEPRKIIAPDAPRATPQGQPGAGRQQHAPAQTQAPRVKQGKTNRPAAPRKDNEDKSDKDHKPHN